MSHRPGAGAAIERDALPPAKGRVTARTHRHAPDAPEDPYDIVKKCRRLSTEVLGPGTDRRAYLPDGARSFAEHRDSCRPVEGVCAEKRTAGFALYHPAARVSNEAKSRGWLAMTRGGSWSTSTR